MIAEPFRHQAETDHQQEAEAQNNDGRVLIDKTGQRTAAPDHQQHCNNHRSDHNTDMIHHPDCRDHGVQREDRIQHDNLCHHRPEFRGFPLLSVVMLTAFQPLVKLHSGFEKQEQSPDQHN